MPDTDIPDNISKLRERVRLSAEKCDLAHSAVQVLAVSKTRPPGDIRVAHDCGLDQFGENYLQEAVAKIEALADLPLSWHFIGPIQSNKTRPIAEHFQWVQSVERGKIARRLNDQRPDGLPPLNVCIQVNISGEASKSGVAPAEAAELAEMVARLPRLTLRGLMAIPAASDDPGEQRRAFAALRSLFDELRRQHPSMDTLSMGMSGDLDAAIAEGATLVRIGTAIFGRRDR